MTQATAQTISANDWRMQLKKYGYLIVLIPALLFPLALLGWESTGSQHDAWWYFPIFVVFGIIPLLDHLIGKDPFNPNEEVDVPRMSLEKWYPLWAPPVPVNLRFLIFLAF